MGGGMTPNMMMMSGMKGGINMGMGMNPGMVGSGGSGPTSNGSNGSWQGQQIGSPGSMHRQSPGLQGEGMPTRMPTIGSIHPNMPMEARRGSPGLPGTYNISTPSPICLKF